MKKSLVCVLVAALSLASVFAGDVASFVDLGFTDDGKYYVFGQYGKIDKKFQGWAEIYQVDIAANDYVDSGAFKTKPAAVTAENSGREVYEALEARSYYYMKDIKCTPANADHVLYILEDLNKKGTDEIKFTDFRGSDIENPDTYTINLVLMTEKVGTPSITREGVSNYKIERIFCDKSERNLIFVIEKMFEDDSGISIRYMVEAAQF